MAEIHNPIGVPRDSLMCQLWRPLLRQACIRLLVIAVLLVLCGGSGAGELYERFNRQTAHGLGYRPISNAWDPGKILGIGLARTLSSINPTPVYDVMIYKTGAVAYRGEERIGRIGDYTGELNQRSDFKKLAEYICKSDFFDLPTRLESRTSDVPGNLLVVRTEEGERWVMDPNFPDGMSSTTWALGKLIDGMVDTASLKAADAIHLTEGFSEIVPAPGFPLLSRKLNDHAPIKLVCFGDSVTGVYYHTGGRRAYTDMIKIALQNGFYGIDITAINAGVSGNTTVNALERIEQDVLAHKPDLVTVMFGLNDMTRVPIEDYRANLRAIVERCRAAGAEVILCTPNSIQDTAERPVEKLIQYADVVRAVAAATDVPLADCFRDFEKVREGNEQQWAMLMSDEIHPNMAGHKQIATTIASTIAGRALTSSGAAAPQPAIPHTIELIHAKQPIEVLAMPPYDTILGKLLREVAPKSSLTITPWKVEGKSMAEIEASAKSIRDNPPDWVFIAVPLEAEAEDFDTFKRHFTWIMNYSLSFKFQEWDVIAVPPDFIAPVEAAQSRERNAWARDLIRAQDFELIGGGGDLEKAEESLRKWLAKQLAE